MAGKFVPDMRGMYGGSAKDLTKTASENIPLPKGYTVCAESSRCPPAPCPDKNSLGHAEHISRPHRTHPISHPHS